MLLGAEKLSAMPEAYVRVLFDQYAPKFEKALVDDLGYRGPALLFKAVLAARQAVRKPAFFKRAIDLGCGTGLAAAGFVKEVDHFIGIDLSPRMIEKARATGLYAKLEVADMVRGLRDRPDASADLVLAADAMVYLPDLAPVLREVKRVLVTGGLLAFTVETHDGDGIILGEGLRYAHSASYVRGSIGEAGLMLSQCEDLSARKRATYRFPAWSWWRQNPDVSFSRHPSSRAVCEAKPRIRYWGEVTPRARRNGPDGLGLGPCRPTPCPLLRTKQPSCCRTAFAAGSQAAAGRRASISWRCSQRPATIAPRS
jgi:predicted TPR repeat methyltransferase